MKADMERVYSLIDERKDEIIEILRKMVRIDSQNFSDGTGREEEMAYHLRDVYSEMGLEPDLFSPLSVGIESDPDYYAGRHLEKRYNCAAVVPGSDHSHRILLAGHEDTVLLGDRSQWKHDPLDCEVEDGKIYGRGVGDDKFGIAVPIFIMKLFKELGIVLPYDVVLAGYSDEENGGSNGALALSLKYPCDEALNLDGAGMEITCAGTGGGVVSVGLVCDEPCDSCAKVLEAFDIFRQELDVWAKEVSSEFRKRPLFRDSVVPDTVARYQDVHAGFNGIEMNRLETEITFYSIHGEEETRKEWAEVERRFNERAKDLHVHLTEWKMMTRFFRFVETDPEGKAVRLLRDACREFCGTDNKPVGICLSDYPMFLRTCPTALTFGCGRPFEVDGGVHQIDEYVEVKELVNFAKILASFLLNYEF